MDLLKELRQQTNELTAWVTAPFDDGVEIELVYVDKRELEKMLDRSKTRKWVRHQQAEELDDRLYEAQLAQKVKAWRGLTLGTVARLTRIEIGDRDPQTEIPCTPHNVQAVLSEIYGFANFISETITEIAHFRAGILEGEVKN